MQKIKRCNATLFDMKITEMDPSDLFKTPSPAPEAKTSLKTPKSEPIPIPGVQPRLPKQTDVFNSYKDHKKYKYSLSNLQKEFDPDRSPNTFETPAIGEEGPFGEEGTFTENIEN